LSDYKIVDNITTDIGSMLIRSNRQGCRQLIKSANVKEDFKITYDLHLKNLKISNPKKIYSNELIRETSSVETYNVGEITNIEENLEYAAWSIEKPRIEKTDNLIRTAFHNGDILVLGQDCTHPELIPKEWTVLDLSNSGTICSSVYLKNHFDIQIHRHSMSLSKLKEMLCDFFEGLTGNTFEFVSNESDEPLFLMHTIDDTKVIGLWSTPIKNTLCLSISLESVDIDTLFTPNTYKYTGSLPVTYSTLIDAWNSLFVNAYSDIISSIEDVSIDGEYYEEDSNGEFVVTDLKDNFKYRIGKPKLMDSEYNIISDETIHTLKDNGDGTYEYIKYPDVDGIFNTLEECFYIDADIYYGSTADGYIQGPGSITWDAEHDAVTGSSAVSNTSSSGVSVETFNLKDGTFIIIRSFFMFDTSAIIDTVTACTMKIYGTTRAATYAAVGVSCQQGTQGTSLTTADYDAFSGNYFAYITSASWSQTAYNSFVFNSTGISAVDTLGTTQICCREYDHDYLDFSPATDTQFAEGMFYANNTGTDKDPYLEIETGGAYKTSPSQKTVIFG
jgi:hypothetical protein